MLKNNLKYYRQLHGLSQAKLGALTEIHPSDISLVESGKKYYHGWGKRISAALGVPIEEIFPTEKKAV